MNALVTRLSVDNRREELLVTDWTEPPARAGSQVKTKTLFSGLTNGTERNDLVQGNYAHPDSALPATWGYQNVGRVIETGPDVRELRVGDIVFSTSDHAEYATFAEDWLMVKLPPEVSPKEAALFGMASVAMRTCRNAGLWIGERTLMAGAGCIGRFAAQIDGPAPLLEDCRCHLHSLADASWLLSTRGATAPPSPGSRGSASPGQGHSAS